MTQRTAAVSSDVGAPFELISEKPAPITSATKARMPQTKDPLRALLQKKRERDKSGFEPLEAASPRPLMALPAWVCNVLHALGTARRRQGSPQAPYGSDGRGELRSDVEKASDRDGRADGPDSHPDNDDDRVGEQDLGPRHVHRGEDVAGGPAASLVVDEEVDEIDDDRSQQRPDQALQETLGHEG